MRSEDPRFRLIQGVLIRGALSCAGLGPDFGDSDTVCFLRHEKLKGKVTPRISMLFQAYTKASESMNGSTNASVNRVLIHKVPMHSCEQACRCPLETKKVRILKGSMIAFVPAVVTKCLDIKS